MPELTFPAGRIVGTLDWPGSYSAAAGPVLATGTVAAPDGVDIGLHAQALRGSEPADGGWNLLPADEPVDLGFVRDLPPDAIQMVDVRAAVEESFGALAHLAPGLKRLSLGWTAFSDAVLPTIAQLTGLTSLQTFGNHFTDDGVQRLVALQQLEQLYLEEETLTLAGFAFVDQLPKLARLGLQDVPLGKREVSQLKKRLRGVDIG